MDLFIANMSNETVQRRLSTEPALCTGPVAVLNFAKAYEDGVARHKTYGYPTTVKEEPVYNVDQGTSGYSRTNRGAARCFRCGFDNFTPAHLKECRAKNEICNKCKVRGHYARCCRGGGSN